MSSRAYLLGAAAAASLIRERALSPTELVRACLDRIDALEPALHAWAYLDPDGTLREAAALEAKRAAGASLGPLAGVPVGVKDIFNTRDMPTQMGSPIWEGFRPGNDARIVHYLRMADAVIPGKTVTAEFAVHAPGPTRNPHNLGHTPGTSSSGSAAAVASGMVPVALGTQTAGSIIRPASYCGIFGFKPSFGLIPRTGMLKTTDTLDTVGMFARDLDDLRLLFDVVRVHGRDYPIAESALAESSRRSKPDDRPWRVAVVRGPRWDDAEAYARAALLGLVRDVSTNAEIVIEDLEIPEIADAHEVHERIYDRSLAYYFKDEFRKHTLVSPIMYGIVTRGNDLTLDDYAAALAAQRRIALRLDALLADDHDVIVTLSTGGEALYGLESADRPDSCLIWTLGHLPTVSLPAFRGPLGLPFGLQVVARRYSDHLLLRFADFLVGLCRIRSGADLVIDPAPLPPST